jgi:hypothetical protein
MSDLRLRQKVESLIGNVSTHFSEPVQFLGFWFVLCGLRNFVTIWGGTNASKLSAQNEAFANLMGDALDQRAIDKMVEIGVLTGLRFRAAAPGFFGKRAKAAKSVSQKGILLRLDPHIKGVKAAGM